MKRSLFLAGLLPLSAAYGAEAPNPQVVEKMRADEERAITEAKAGWWAQTQTTKEARLAWWREARFGCFMHWGAYSQLAGEWQGKRAGTYSEHIQRSLKISMADYRHDAIEKFNPQGFDADAWVQLLKRAGMKYLIITAKHHDGFAMYDSAVSDYNIVKATPFHRDPMRELKDACVRHGLKFGFYYSHAFDWGEANGAGNDWEWNNPGGDKLLGGKDWWLSQPDDLTRIRAGYVEKKAIPQIQELIRKYQPDIMWFDTPGKLPFVDNLHILQALREVGPNVVVNGRLARASTQNFGDYSNTGDRAAEFSSNGGDWEAIPTTNESYGYHKLDQSHKPPAFFVRLLAKAVARNGNLLLNIGPMGDGHIDPKDVSILENIGKWMGNNAISITGCGQSPLPLQAWGVSTQRNNTIYLHVFDWPRDGRLVVGGLKTLPRGAHLLAPRNADLHLRKINDSDVEITLPPKAPDAMDSVVVLQFNGAVQAGGTRLLSPQTINRLLTFDAVKDGAGADKLGYGDGKENRYYIINWKSDKQALHWDVRLNEAATFKVAIRYVRGEPESSGIYRASAGNWNIEKPVAALPKADTPQRDELGQLTLPVGVSRIELRAAKLETGELMRPLEVILSPVEKNTGKP